MNADNTTINSCDKKAGLLNGKFDSRKNGGKSRIVLLILDISLVLYPFLPLYAIYKGSNLTSLFLGWHVFHEMKFFGVLYLMLIPFVFFFLFSKHTVLHLITNIICWIYLFFVVLANALCAFMSCFRYDNGTTRELYYFILYYFYIYPIPALVTNIVWMYKVYKAKHTPKGIEVGAES